MFLLRKNMLNFLEFCFLCVGKFILLKHSGRFENISEETCVLASTPQKYKSTHKYKIVWNTQSLPFLQWFDVTSLLYSKKVSSVNKFSYMFVNMFTSMKPHAIVSWFLVHFAISIKKWTLKVVNCKFHRVFKPYTEE